MKLILHIGAHKTGSTSIQYFLSDHEKQLTLHNWECSTYSKDLNWGRLFRFGKSDHGKALFSYNESIYEQFLVQCKVGLPNKVVSAEDFFFLSDSQLINRLARDLQQIFSEIKIVVFLRNQVDAAISNKAQGARTSQSALVFGNDPTQTLPNLTPDVVGYLSYSDKLAMWRKAFPKAVFSVIDYGQIDDSVKAFIDVSGLPLNVDKTVIANSSVEGNLKFLLHQLRGANLPPELVWSLYSNRVVTNQGGTKDTISREQAAYFLAHFDKDNSELLETFGVSLSSNLDNYPENAIVPSIDHGYQVESLIEIIRYLYSAKC